MVDVVVLKCNNYYTSVYDIVAKALDTIKAKEIIKKGMKVLIKPNLLLAAEPDRAITTHPLVIDAICKYLKDLNVKVFIGESSGAASNGTKQAFKKCGMQEVAEKYGIELISFDEDEHVVKKNDTNFVMKNIPISKNLDEMDVIINACKLKTHMLTGYTGAVKNMFGVLPGRTKINAHANKNLKKFCNLLLDIYSTVKPQICIMDGIIGMEGNGPNNGIIRETGLIIASTNAIALDVIAADIIGYKFKDLEFLKQAEKRNLVPADINVLGEKNVQVLYKKPLSHRFGVIVNLFNFFIKGLQAGFEADKKKCVKCGTCVKACPQGAITMKEYPEWDKKKCIMCYCCHEQCPYDAIRLRKPFFAKLAEKYTKRFSD
jgi:uncharacterized protein (DUF362 family)/NAD-dependent dihydropyrimidine dehydrogenase PreA subunit